MVNCLYIGLNLHTVFLLELLAFFFAVVITFDPRSVIGRAGQALAFFAVLASIAMILASLLHEPLF